MYTGTEAWAAMSCWPLLESPGSRPSPADERCPRRDTAGTIITDSVTGVLVVIRRAARKRVAVILPDPPRTASPP